MSIDVGNAEYNYRDYMFELPKWPQLRAVTLRGRRIEITLYRRLLLSSLSARIRVEDEHGYSYRCVTRGPRYHHPAATNSRENPEQFGFQGGVLTFLHAELI